MANEKLTLISAPDQPLRRLVTSGMLWATFGTLASKFASLGAQLVLGWVLSKEDFALYAIAIAWSTMVLALRNGGTQRLLIQQGEKYEDYATVFFKIAVLFNGLGFLVLILAAPVLSSLYESPALSLLLWIIALSLPLSTASMVFQAKLSSELNFRHLTQLNISSAVLRHGSMAAFALMGLGPISFVLPLLVIAIFETVGGWYLVGKWPPNRPLTWSKMRGVLIDTRWIMLTTLAGILTMNGDYLAVSLLQSKETLGVYYFGFQLTFSIAVLFNNGVEGVMMPTFSRLDNDQERQKVAFLKAVRVLMLGSTLACFALFLGASSLVHGLWAGKWDSAIPVVQLLALSLPVKMVMPLCRSLMEGRGEWRIVSTLLLADGFGTVIAGGLGAWLGGVVAIAATVSVYNLSYGLFFCGIITRRIGGQIRTTFVPMLTTLAFGILALLTTALLTYVGSVDSTNIWQAAMLILTYVAVYLGLTRFFLRDSLAEATNLILTGVSSMWRPHRVTG
ncbi:MAG: oligosaccharide flippase family protein [Nitrospira sp.]|jgi:teichuronic acid exporter|nr:oligosaccharide flippase family protein [Nitrospira sp.]